MNDNITVGVVILLRKGLNTLAGLNRLNDRRLWDIDSGLGYDIKIMIENNHAGNATIVTQVVE